MKQNKGSKKKFIYHHLVEAYRTEKGPRQRLLLDLGKLSIPKSQWKRLANRIEELVNGNDSLFAEDEEIEALARHYAALLRRKQLEQQPEAQEKTEPLYEEVDVHSVKVHQVRSIGGEHVALSMLDRLGFTELLQGFGFDERQRKLALLLVVSRMLHPGSERETVRWVTYNSAISELLELPLSAVYPTALYRVSDRLLSVKEGLEAGLSHRERTLFSLAEKVVLYDLTNSYFASRRESELKRRGRSKEKRNDCPLVTLGLVLDEDGFPKGSHLFRGNISEPETLSQILQEVGSGGRKLFILDAGVATEANLSMIRASGHDYLVVSRSKPGVDLSDLSFEEIHHDQDHLVEAGVYHGEEELWLVCRSRSKGAKESSIRDYHQERFEAELERLSSGLGKKGYTKRYDKVLERIGRLRERYKRVSYFYEISVKERDGLATEIFWRIKDDQALDARFSGEYYLRTSRMELSSSQIWRLYISLTDVEDSFRSMKSDLGMRPNYHQRDERIMGHIFITVLAHHVVHSIQRYLHEHGIYARWSTIRSMLCNQHRVTTEFRRRDGSLIRLRQTSEPELFQHQLSRALQIPAKPLGTKWQILKNL